MSSSGRGRRAIAFVLSLILPGAGHILLGSFRRGVVWAVGVVAVGIGVLFALPVGLPAVVLALSVGIAGHLGSAVDTLTLTAGRPRWAFVLVGWGALIAGSLVLDPLKDSYRAHYAQAFTIPSGAMMNTLLAGDYILVDKTAYRTRPPQRGDVVVFPYPQDEQRDFIKRIVGMPGDVISVRGRRVVVNDKLLDEPYLRPVDAAPSQAADTSCRLAFGCDPTTVPPDSYFVMGDNRDNSQDSRYWGFVKRDKIKGKAAVIYWSWDRDRRWLRWERFGKAIS